MWSEYIVKPFEGKNTGKHKRKQAALEDAQRRALNNPGKSITAYRAKHYNTGMCDLIPVITYWYDETTNKLQYESGGVS